MKTCHIIKSGLIILLLSLPKIMLADIAPDPLTAGKSLYRFGDEVTDVRMVAEDVLVRVFECEIVTVAKFSMYNKGETVTMEVGFPYAYEGDFIEFSAYIDGQEIQVRDEKQENIGRKKSTVRWKLWNMTFEKQEACEIRVEYKTKTLEYEHTFLWTDSYKSMPESEIDTAQNLTRQGSVSYWLNSGKAWKGVLDHCRIEVELVGKSDANIYSYWPEDGNYTGRGIVWEYTDYEPTNRVTMRYYPNMVVKAIPSYLLDLLEKYPNDPHLTRSVGTRLRGHFRDIDLSTEVYHSFLTNWDGQIPQLMEYASGGRCRYDYKGDGGDFYTIWTIAKLLFSEYERQGMLDKVADIAPSVSKISSAIADSLNTCGNLSENNAHLYEDAIHLLNQSNSLIEAEK